VSIFPDNDESNCALYARYITCRKIFENKEKLNAVLGGICEADALTDLTRESLLVRNPLES